MLYALYMLATLTTLAQGLSHAPSARLHSSVRAFSAGGRSALKRNRMVAAATESRFITDNVGNNVTPYIENLVGRDLHKIPDHPLGIIKDKIEGYFNSLDGDIKFDTDGVDAGGVEGGGVEGGGIDVGRNDDADGGRDAGGRDRADDGRDDGQARC